ncbi:hypothetical protein NDU88_002107 [Pleurodeles waltl]|uniref:Uncharacterized protein n=1 Tax=Pleurodeles waltl TaxID=8319 RepID=A0AAV7U8Q6_PLEWA|nr:hypothetical protein NDU88_002107 [Pleurodeles waltl]
MRKKLSRKEKREQRQEYREHLPPEIPESVPQTGMVLTIAATFRQAQREDPNPEKRLAAGLTPGRAISCLAEDTVGDSRQSDVLLAPPPRTSVMMGSRTSKDIELKGKDEDGSKDPVIMRKPYHPKLLTIPVL